jgi:protein gp37
MSLGTSIEWTDATWNPVRGCDKISAGCKNCYAERFSERFRGVPGHPFEQGFDIRLVPEKLAEPLKWKEPRMIFVNSMSDLFHDKVPDEYIEQVVRVMILARWHTFQVLTKRGNRLKNMLRGPLKFAADAKNIWWGVSVENRRDGVPRIRQLQRAPAAVRFLSVEPLLEDVGRLNLKGISWVIVGGESGPHSRPMKAEWVTSLREQCEASGVAFFFKQWGGARKKLTGRTLEGRTYSEFPARHERKILPESQRLMQIRNYSSMQSVDVPLAALSL